MKAYIKAIDYYLPEQVLTNEQLSAEFPEWSADKITSNVGVNKRYLSAENETSLDMAIQAAEKLFSSGRVKREEIDFVLFCTQSPDYYLPTSACIIQDRLQLSTNCGALDFNLGCSGYVYGLSLAKGLLHGNIALNILLLTGETYTKYLHPADKGNRTIFGDAATASVISTTGFAEIGDFCLGTDGSGEKNLILETGGARNPEKINNVWYDNEGNPKSSDHIFMDGSEIFSFTISAVPRLIKDILEKSCFQLEDIDLFILHQCNQYILEYLRKKMKIDPDKFYLYLSEVGNTVSSTIPIAIVEAIKDNTLKEGMRVVLTGFGVGYSWGACILQF